MKRIIIVPVWLREWLASRNLGYDVLVTGNPDGILSATDVKAYRDAQVAASELPLSVNPLKPIVTLFSDSYIFASVLPPVRNKLEAEYGRAACDDEIFHYFMVEGESAVGFKNRINDPAAKEIVGNKCDFDFERVGDTMVVVASSNQAIDNRKPGFRAELYSKCIDKLHLFMSFEEIATTDVFKAFLQAIQLENCLVRETAGSSL